MSKATAARIIITQHLNSLEGHYSRDSADHFSPCTSSSSSSSSSSVCTQDAHNDHHQYHFHPSSSRLHHKQCGKVNSHRTCDGMSKNIHDSSCKVMMRAKDKQSYLSKTGTRSKHEHLMTTTGLLCIISLFLCRQLCEASWDQWWTYDGISGPSFWGRLNPKWNLCSKGKKQSPIDVNPAHLLFDPSLGSLDFVGNEVSGNLTNTGRGIVFKVSPKIADTDSEVTLSAGPLSYRYTLHHLELHFGREITRGSEHSIDSTRYPGEIQAYFYNSQLYTNWDESIVRAHGIAAIALLIQLNPDGRKVNPSLRKLTHALKNITVKGSSEAMSALSMQDLMPSEVRKQYVTYEGSLTQPSCQETVEWILLNKPIYMTSNLFNALRTTMSSENSHGADNFRPSQKLNSRTVRTNIDFNSPTSHSSSSVSHHQTHSNSSNLQVTGGGNKMCSMKRSLFTYKANFKSFPGDLV